nr:alpha-mannosidase [Priestia megaterium]
MEGNQTVHIISHTHWDREWYLPYEKHHMYLIKLMDQLLEVLENDSDFKSFHLDGQTIILEDYLQVRPQMREKLKQFIQEGRIYIGPWYILQDEFLTSSESNVRNLLYGMKDSKEWGGISNVGYFPDSFGNIGQAPQVLSQAGIHHAVFGRGVKPTGFNNVVQEDTSYESPYSEMLWRSPDGSSVLGILFANWYCNGNEVPVAKELAQDYWDKQLQSLKEYASTPHLLLMNGCDHQPIQLNLPEALRTAKKLNPDVDFMHSNFNAYCEKLASSIPSDIKIIDGELRSQHTDGWGTLVNTASSRIYIKQMNQQSQVLLEKVAEPLATFAYLQGETYDHGLFEYGWKILMQNHPHDSICGCSVDEVHREMVTRFEKCQQVAEVIIDKSLASVTRNIDTTTFTKWGEDAIPFAVYNTTGQIRTGIVSVVLDVRKEYFSAGVNKQQLKAFPLGTKILVDAYGNRMDCEWEDLGIAFDYELPDNQFRQPFMARRVRLSFEAKNIPTLGYETFALVHRSGASKTASNQSLVINEREMENKYTHVKMNENGSLVITNKENGRIYKDLCIYEDTGDIGNEYMYKQPKEETPLTTKDTRAEITIIKDSPFRAVYQIVHEWDLPKGASKLLDQEQQELVWFTERQAKRVTDTITHTITTYVTLEKNNRGVQITTSFTNQAKDHRLRMLFPTDIQTDTHYADSVFEVAERSNEPAKDWANPDYSQHQQAFVNVSNELEGLTIANFGLNEYEILRDGRNTIAITLLRSVRELGDWGYFPTPEAQCLGEQTASICIYPHEGERSKLVSFQDSYQYQVPLTVKQAAIQEGVLPPAQSFVEWQSNLLAFTSLKVSDESSDVIARGFNLTNRDARLTVHSPASCNYMYRSNVLEEVVSPFMNEIESSCSFPVKKHEIVTIGFSKQKL